MSPCPRVLPFASLDEFRKAFKLEVNRPGITILPVDIGDVSIRSVPSQQRPPDPGLVLLVVRIDLRVSGQEDDLEIRRALADDEAVDISRVSTAVAVQIPDENAIAITRLDGDLAKRIL